MKHLKQKKNALIHHSIKRAKQRYNLDLNEHQIREISNIISQQRPNCVWLSTQSNMKSRWAVKYKDVVIPVIYDKNRHIIVTILEENMLTSLEKQRILTL